MNDSFELKDIKQVPNDYVTVKITDKSGFTWEATGDAGMVIIHNKNRSEVDAIGNAENLARLLITAMKKVGSLVGHDVVEHAIQMYRK